MNNRRIFLTKDEVKLSGIELTENITEPIRVLYLPIKTINSSLPSFNIKFYYWSSTSDTAYNKTISSSSTNNGFIISQNNDKSYVLVNSSSITFNFNCASSNTNIINYNRISYSLFLSSRQDLNHSLTNTSINIIDVAGYNDPDNYYGYVKIDLMGLPVTAYGAKFDPTYIKYKEGTIPADTIFYEPGTYE